MTYCRALLFKKRLPQHVSPYHTFCISMRMTIICWSKLCFVVGRCWDDCFFDFVSFNIDDNLLTGTKRSRFSDWGGIENLEVTRVRIDVTLIVLVETLVLRILKITKKILCWQRNCVCNSHCASIKIDKNGFLLPVTFLWILISKLLNCLNNTVHSVETCFKLVYSIMIKGT